VATEHPRGKGQRFEEWRSEAIRGVGRDGEVIGEPGALEAEVLDEAEEVAEDVDV
jgi:hypothetical protein